MALRVHSYPCSGRFERHEWDVVSGTVVACLCTASCFAMAMVLQQAIYHGCCWYQVLDLLRRNAWTARHLIQLLRNPLVLVVLTRERRACSKRACLHRRYSAVEARRVIPSCIFGSWGIRCRKGGSLDCNRQIEAVLLHPREMSVAARFGPPR